MTQQNSEIFIQRYQHITMMSPDYASCSYLDSIDRISHSKYVPNEQDVLRTRVKSTGVVEMPFKHNGTKFKSASLHVKLLSVS